MRRDIVISIVCADCRSAACASSLSAEIKTRIGNDGDSLARTRVMRTLPLWRLWLCIAQHVYRGSLTTLPRKFYKLLVEISAKKSALHHRRSCDMAGSSLFVRERTLAHKRCGIASSGQCHGSAAITY
jgi:hypothetical protein